MEPDTFLTDIDNLVFRKLINSLAKSDAWRTVAEFLMIFDQKKISSLSLTACPAESLLIELEKKLCTVGNLKTILKECCLYEAFLIIAEPERMQILRQPTTSLQEDNEKLCVQIGNALELEFKVVSIPPPRFQWFKDGEMLINQTTSILHIKRFSPSMEGKYHCCSSQNLDVLNSDDIQVEALPVKCTILEKPDDFIYLPEGSDIVLKLDVFGHPKPNYEWVHDNSVLKHENKNKLMITHSHKKHSGIYRCYVSNKVSVVEVITTVTIYEQNVSSVHKPPVSDKVALLIANDQYDNLNSLSTPANDVCTIAQTLHNFAFKTVCLRNLNLLEMECMIETFSEMVYKDSFAFFYYAGHGLEITDRFLLPSDTPETTNITKSDGLSESKILSKVLAKQPQLFMLLLDMCLGLPNKKENPSIYKEAFVPYTFTAKRNIIRGFSTTTNLNSFEREGDPNGIYVTSLKHYLSKDLPILTILNNVNADIASKCPEQIPSIYYNTVEDFYFNCPIISCNTTGTELFSSLIMSEETTHFNGAIITLKSHKCMQNVIDIIVSNAETFDYNDNSRNLTIEELGEGSSRILRISNIQRLAKGHVHIKLIINNSQFFIDKHFQITNIIG